MNFYILLIHSQLIGIYVVILLIHFGCYKSYCCECSWIRFCVGNPFISSFSQSLGKKQTKIFWFWTIRLYTKVVSVEFSSQGSFCCLKNMKNKDVSLTLYIRVIRYSLYWYVFIFLRPCLAKPQVIPRQCFKKLWNKEILGEGIWPLVAWTFSSIVFPIEFP